MTMQPAPTDNGTTYCSLDCRGSIVDVTNDWTFDGRFAISFCPECGRALSFDADGEPIVGPVPPQQLTLTEKPAATTESITSEDGGDDGE